MSKYVLFNMLIVY